MAPHTWYQNHYHKTEGATTSPMLTVQCVLVRTPWRPVRTVQTDADLSRMPTVAEINSRYSRGFILDRNFDTPVVLGLGQH